MVERLLWEQEVPGSSPGLPTMTCLGLPQVSGAGRQRRQAVAPRSLDKLRTEFISGLYFLTFLADRFMMKSARMT